MYDAGCCWKWVLQAGKIGGLKKKTGDPVRKQNRHKNTHTYTYIHTYTQMHAHTYKKNLRTDQYRRLIRALQSARMSCKAGLCTAKHTYCVFHNLYTEFVYDWTKRETVLCVDGYIYVCLCVCLLECACVYVRVWVFLCGWVGGCGGAWLYRYEFINEHTIHTYVQILETLFYIDCSMKVKRILQMCFCVHMNTEIRI